MSITPSEPPTEPPVGAVRGTVARVLDAVASACMAIAGVMMVTLIVIFGWLVFGRYVLNDTPTWVEQTSLLLVAWITFLGAAVGAWRSSHLSIDFVRDAMPVRLGALLHAVSDLAMVAFGAVMAWQGWVMAVSTHRRIIPMLGLSESWRAAPVAIAGVLIMIFAGATLVARLAPHRPSARPSARPDAG